MRPTSKVFVTYLLATATLLVALDRGSYASSGLTGQRSVMLVGLHYEIPTAPDDDAEPIASETIVDDSCESESDADSGDEFDTSRPESLEGFLRFGHPPEGSPCRPLISRVSHRTPTFLELLHLRC